MFSLGDKSALLVLTPSAFSSQPSAFFNGPRARLYGHVFVDMLA